MRYILATLGVLIFAVPAASAVSALTALRVLLPEQAQNVALITGREGMPEPDRWHVIVFDPTSETGLREYVIAGGRRVASRTVSQFIERLSLGDVMATGAIKVDSDRLVKTALQYGAANNKTIAAMHFDLRKGPTDGTPLWTIICTDLTGGEMGRLLVSASRGEVLSHPGFATEPPLDSVAERPPVIPAPGTEGGDSRKTTVPKKTATPVPLATPLPLATPKPPLLRRLFGGGNPR
jgi:hypothetical protein